MRIVLNLILFLLAVGLTYVLYSSIKEPIAFQREKVSRKDAVVAKLMKVRTAQELYRSIKGEFASDFDSLNLVLKNDSFAIVKVIGDPDDPTFTGEITYDTFMSPAYDSVMALNINLDSLQYVPYTGGKSFEIKADTISYQKTTVPVVEVGTPWKTFMGDYADIRYARYDQRYDPNNFLKFGDMNAPSLAGNWEK